MYAYVCLKKTCVNAQHSGDDGAAEALWEWSEAAIVRVLEETGEGGKENMTTQEKRKNVSDGGAIETQIRTHARSRAKLPSRRTYM